MILRALLAFAALPGIVAFLVPGLFLAATDRLRIVHAIGVPVAATGLALLLWCTRDFLVRGHGTLAPWDPPTTLVTRGPYRFTRNPMYVAVTAILAGEALASATPELGLYALAVAVAFHLRVVLHEEPFLARTQGERWRAYAARVPRWIGRGAGRAR